MSEHTRIIRTAWLVFWEALALLYFISQYPFPALHFVYEAF